MDAPPIQYTKTEDGVSIAYCAGGDGPTLIRAGQPGATHVQLEWEFEYAMELAKRFRYVLYDSRGSGLSDREKLDFSMEAMQRDLEAVVLAACPGTFSLSTFGQYAPIGLTYAAAHPDRVVRLVVVDGEARSGDWERAVPALGRTYRLLAEIDWDVYAETTARVVMGVEDPEGARQIAAFLRACIDQEGMLALNRARDEWDARDLLSAIKAPTLVVHRKNHPWMPARLCQQLAASIPGARFASIAEKLPAFQELVAVMAGFLGEEASHLPSSPTPFRTVLFTDVVGHTEMMRRLGDEPGREVLREHEGITREVLKANGGTEVKTMGDGFMASFASVVKAVECAIALQKAFDERNADVRAHHDAPLRVRCGLNAGEPIEDEGPDGRSDLFGSTVILAARIAAQAEGGEILASNVVRELCSGKPFLFADRGEHAMKGFDEAVRVYEINWRA